MSTQPVNFFWDAPPAPPTLSGSDVHIWSAALDRPMAQIQQLAQTLSPNEAARAQRFVFDRDREHYIVGRGLLREILSHYLKTPPARLQFRYGPQGKPELDTGPAPLHFNLSHSGGVVLYAVTRQQPLGVDVEAIRPLEDLEQIAEHFFSAAENSALRSLSPADKPTAFFNCWTRKEAFIKAVGEGLSYPLDQFDVTLTPGQPAQLLRVQNDPQATARWSLVALAPAPNYVAALAIETGQFQLNCWRWSTRAAGKSTSLF